MVRIVKLERLEYDEAILDSPEFRHKLQQHEKHIVDLNKNLKVLLKKIKEVIAASEALRNAQDSFSVCLRDFEIGFTTTTDTDQPSTNNLDDDENNEVVDSLDFVFFLFQDIKEFSSSMINAGHNVIKVLDAFRKNRIDAFNEKKKDYERQTARYCSSLEKNLQAVLVQNKKSNNNNISINNNSSSSHTNEEDVVVMTSDKLIKEENQLFYVKCLEYVYSIQELEYDWFSFFSGNVLQYVQSWMNFYHESYEKHMECESRVAKSKEGLGKLTQRIEQIKQVSTHSIQRTLKNPESCLNSCQVYSAELHASTSKQGYLYLLEKKTLGSSGRVKMFCKYYKELRRLECTPYNQTTNKQHQPEVYYVNGCARTTTTTTTNAIRSSAFDKKLTFEVSLSSGGQGYNSTNNNIHTYQAIHYDDYKAWLAVLIDGCKDLTPPSVSSSASSYANRIEPVYILDRNGINFVKRCIQLLEIDKLSEEGIYRKNGVSHKIVAFIERNYHNLAGSTITTNNTNNTTLASSSNHSNSSSSSNMDSLSNGSQPQPHVVDHTNKSSVRQSNSLYTLNGVVNMESSPVMVVVNSSSLHTSSKTNLDDSSNSSSDATTTNTTTNFNSSQSMMDTCTITSALKHYLLHLREPLMTYKHNQEFLDACSLASMGDKFAEIYRLVHSLPDVNYELLDVLVGHLSRVAAQSALNKMTAGNLATCFGPTVFRGEQAESVSNLYSIKFYSEIVEILIIYHAEMFNKHRPPDSLFLSQLTPIRGGGGGTTSMMTNLTTINSSSLLFSTPSPLSNGKNKNHQSSSIKRTGGPLNELLSYKNVLMNNSSSGVVKAAAASSSSSVDSSSEFTLNSTANNTSTPTSTKASSNNNNNTKTSRIITTSLISTPISSYNNTTMNGGTVSSSSSAHHTSTLTPPSGRSSSSSNTTNHLITSTPSSSKTASKPTAKMSNSSSATIIMPPLNVSTSSSTTTTPNNNNTLNSSSLQKSSNSMNSLSSNYNLSSLSPSTSSSQDNKSSPNNNSSSNRPRRARTLYQCLADNPSELSFEANVILLNVRKSKESGWLEASYNGKSGLVPGNYVQLLDD